MTDKEIMEAVRTLRDKVHHVRYYTTWQQLKGYLKPGTKVLNWGESYGFWELLAKEYDITWQAATFDLRYQWPINEQFDLVVGMEVIEHIKDKESDDMREVATATHSGIINCLSESYRNLVPGGTLWLSTPNICGLRSLYNIIHMRHPFTYTPHPRELTIEDLKNFLKTTQFKEIKYTTPVVWQHHGIPAVTVEPLFNMLQQFKGPIEHRGDCIMMSAKK